MLAPAMREWISGALEIPWKSLRHVNTSTGQKEKGRDKKISFYQYTIQKGKIASPYVCYRGLFCILRSIKVQSYQDGRLSF